MKFGRWYNVFTLCYSGDGGADGAAAGGTEGDGAAAGDGSDGAAAGGTVVPAAGKSKTFTQDEVNRVLAKERREHQQKTQRAIDELQALKTKVNITTQERADLESRIEELQGSISTKEELARQALAKESKKHTAELENLKTELGSWKGRYTESTISRALTDAAVEHKAIVPLQIAAILRPSTRLVEAVDAEGKPTGTYEAKVKLDDVDGDGKPVTLDLSVSDAVKRMREMELHQNLFQGDGTGGLGSQNRGKGKSGAPTSLNEAAHKGPEAYRKARKTQDLK